MASSLNSSSSDETQRRSLVECPVCVQTFKNPKSLPCGHSVCADCCRLLNRERVNLICPVCRRASTVSAENLPINFGLRDLVQHFVDSVGAKSFTCARCNQKSRDEETWLCTECRAVVCCSCAIRNHQSHKLQEIKELLSEKEGVLRDWRNSTKLQKNEVGTAYHQINLNRLKLTKNGQLVNNTLRTKLIPKMEAVTDELKKELVKFEKQCDEVNAVRLINDEINNRDDVLTNIPHNILLLKAKQELVIKNQNEALEILNKCNEGLMRLVSGYANSSNEPVTTEDGNAVATQSRRVTSAAVTWADVIQGRRNSNADFLDSDGVVDGAFGNTMETAIRASLNFTNRAPAGRPRTHLSTLMISPRIATQFDASSDEETPRQQQRETESGRRRLVLRRRAAPNVQVRLASPTNSTAANQEAVVVVEDDSVEEMDVVPTTSAGGSAARFGSPGPSPLSANRSGTQKRFRRCNHQTPSTSSESSDDEEDLSHRAVDSTISFHILRKNQRNH